MRSTPEAKRVRRRLIVSLLFSQLIVWGGIYWAWHVGVEGNKVAHSLFHVRDAVARLEKVTSEPQVRVR